MKPLNYIAGIFFIAIAISSELLASDSLNIDPEYEVLETEPLPAIGEKIHRVLNDIKRSIFADADLQMWDYEHNTNLDQVADYFFSDSIPPQVSENFPFLHSDQLKVQKKADDFFDVLGSSGHLLASLTGLEKVKFPVGLVYPTESGVKISIGIERMEFDGLVASLKNIFMKVEFAGAPPLIFGAPEISFTRTGGFVEATLGLIGDVPIPVNGSPETLLILKGYNFRTKKGCVAKISCDGFESASLDMAVYLSRNLVFPVDAFGRDTKKYLHADLNATVHDFRNISGGLSFNQSFKVKGVDKVIFTVREALFDGSEFETDPGIPFPVDYFSGDAQGFETAQWQGVYIDALKIQLDHFYDLQTEDEFGIEVQQMLIDRYGVTGRVAATNLLSLDKGSIGTARISIDRVEVELWKSSIKPLCASGLVTVPVLGGRGEDSGIRYVAKVCDNAWSASASVLNGDTLHFPIFKDALQLYPGTALTVGRSYETDKPVVQVNLCGRVDPAKVWPAKIEKPSSDSSGIYFENFTVQSISPVIKNVGFWRIPRQIDIPFGPILFTIDDVAAGNTSEGDFVFHFYGGASFSGDEGFNISGEVGVNIFGVYNADDQLEYDRTEVERVGLCIATNSWGGRVELNWFNEDPNYGNGFQGRAAVSVKSMGYEEEAGCDFNAGIFANAIFGKVDSSRFYNFELLYLNLKKGISMGPLALHGIGGAISNGMVAEGIRELDFAKINVADTAQNSNSSSTTAGLGNSILGISYVPDPDAGFSIRLMTIAASEGKSNIINMNADLSFNFNSGGGLDSIRFDVDGQMLKAISVGRISRENVPVYFGCLMLYDNVNNLFLLNAEIDIDLERQIVGGGHLTLYIDREKWYIHVGKPGVPGDLGLIIPIIGLETNAYFCAGSYNVPDMPPLPPEIRNVFKNSGQRNFDVSNDLAGMAFGAHLNLGDPEEKDFLFFYYKLHILVGLDVNIRNYEGYSCSGDPTFGMHQWYGKGQVYAYVNGAVGISAGIKKFPILDLMAAFKIYLETPRPTYGEFAVAVRFKVLGGLIKGRAKIEASFGSQCILDKNNIELNVFDDVITPSNDQPLHVAQDITFSGGVPFYRSFPDDVGNSLFQVRVEDDVKSTVDNLAQNDFEKIGYAYYTKDGTTSAIRCRKVFSEDNTFVTYIPDETWPPNAEVWINPIAHFQQSINGGNSWSPVEDQNGNTSQDTIYSFVTGDYPDKIPAFNIEYSYPLNRMSNYYPAQNNGIGVIKLKKGMNAIFEGKEVMAHIICQASGVEPITSICSYNSQEKTLQWTMPAERMVNGQLYELHFTSQKKDIIDPIYFRCSIYDRVEDKLAVAFNSNEVLPQPKQQAIVLNNESELFDEMELHGAAELAPLLHYQFDISVLQNPLIYPLVDPSELDQADHIFFYNQFANTQFVDGSVPKIEVIAPDQLGEIPIYIEPSGVRQKLTSTIHIAFLDNLLQKMILQNYFDLNDPNFATYFGTPNGFQTSSNFDSSTGQYDNSNVGAWELGQQFKHRWQHPAQMKINWSYQIGELVMFDASNTYSIESND
ncbi:MAG: hypothetical protein IPL46_13325 [Saprospiraceae bacterium]|nr:hypothetical protein [Saprospiraceae bacterium]